MPEQLFTPFYSEIPFEAVIAAEVRLSILKTLFSVVARTCSSFNEADQLTRDKPVLRPKARRQPRLALKLVYRTHNDQQPSKLIENVEPAGTCYRVDVRDFGDGIVELVASRQQEPMKKRKHTSDDSRDKGKRKEMNENDLLKSVLRAKRQMRSKILMMGASRMLTLTYRENKTDLAECWKDLRRFVRLVKKQIPDFQYIAVPEFQKRGAVHFHIAVKGFYNYNLMRFLWRKAICGNGTETVGAANFTSPRKGSEWRRAALSRYMAKYMSKGIESQEKNKKRYSSSQDISDPEKTTFWLLPSDCIFYRLTQIMDSVCSSGMKRFHEVLGADRPIVWMASY